MVAHDGKDALFGAEFGEVAEEGWDDDRVAGYIVSGENDEVGVEFVNSFDHLGDKDIVIIGPEMKIGEVYDAQAV